MTRAWRYYLALGVLVCAVYPFLGKETAASTAVYLMTTGALRHAAAFPIEQLVRMPERDGYGPVEYRFSASAEYRDTSIELTEHLSVNSKGQGETRSSDLQRALRLENGQLLASGESLWTKTQRVASSRTSRNAGGFMKSCQSSSCAEK